MKIVQLVESHSEKMGYSDVCLSKAFNYLGHDVSVVTTTENSYFNTSEYNDIFKNFLYEKNQLGKKEADGYTLYRLEYIKTPFGIYIRDLYTTIKKINPDVVQAGELISLSTLQCAILSIFLPFKFTVECHIHASVFNISASEKNFIKKIKKSLKKYFNFFQVFIISILMQKCYPISKDSYDICNKFFFIPKKKLLIRTLGTDLSTFYKYDKFPLDFKVALGFNKNDIVCIYTGRLTNEKGPHILKDAINFLQKKGHSRFKGLFIGSGSKSYCEKFKNNSNLKLLPFVEYRELNQYYNMSNIGVWPKQESTSQIDALGAGLVIIINHNSGVIDRAENSGLIYKEGSHIDLADKILELKNDKFREQMSRNAINKSIKLYDWKLIAQKYVEDYKKMIQQ